jgi:hypothetical protein
VNSGAVVPHIFDIKLQSNSRTFGKTEWRTQVCSNKTTKTSAPDDAVGVYIPL